MKLCKDCAHKGCDPSPYRPFPAKCWAPQANKSPVYGGSIEECDSARLMDDRCGPNAAWFEPEPIKVTWFKRIFGYRG